MWHTATPKGQQKRTERHQNPKGALYPCFLGVKPVGPIRSILAMKSWIALSLLIAPFMAGAACFEQAATRYSVPVELLKAISTVESNGNPSATNKNKNGSVDYGHMQINDWWLPKLEPYGISRQSLLDPCTNTYVGAWILAQNIATHGLTWKAIGAYNAKTEYKRLVYARKVERVLQKTASRQAAIK